MLNKKALSATAAAQPLYVEDVFSTYLYTGNGSTQTITNGIDLAGEGGMVWIKPRNQAQDHIIFDTLRGVTKSLTTNNTAAEYTATGGTEGLSSFNVDGFTAKLYQNNTGINNSSCNNASWTFRQAKKFFDVVTYTGNGSLPNQLISHNLGSVPGCIIIKSTDAARDWIVWHRGNGTTNYAGLSLNLTSASAGSVSSGDLPTSTQFKPAAFFDPNYNNANETGVTYVAYLFAHDAGGFGNSGSESVIKCGSVTADGSGNATVNLGWEPQWILIKSSSATNNWALIDNMRGFPATDLVTVLNANSSAAENSGGLININSTGFYSNATLSASTTYIYVAIRRGPMKTPEAGTEVFTPLTAVPTSGIFQSNILTDSFWVNTKSGSSAGRTWVYDRLRGNDKILTPRTNNIQTLDTGTDAEGTYSASTSAFQRNEDFAGGAGFTNTDYDGWAFKRAPGFFDIVCYTGTGSARTVTHNLGVAPELMIVKRRDSAENWAVYASGLTDPASWRWLKLNLTDAQSASSAPWDDTAPTSTVFSLSGVQTTVNASGGTYVAYLFATLAGVSKVGSYTGNGSNQTINCGFTAGARFVMIKRINATGNWSVFDTARGIVSGNDPYVILNAPGTQSVSSTDSVDPDNSGFIVNQNATSNLNVNAATYIFLAIA